MRGERAEGKRERRKGRVGGNQGALWENSSCIFKGEDVGNGNLESPD